MENFYMQGNGLARSTILHQLDTGPYCDCSAPIMYVAPARPGCMYILTPSFGGSDSGTSFCCIQCGTCTCRLFCISWIQDSILIVLIVTKHIMGKADFRNIGGRTGSILALASVRCMSRRVGLCRLCPTSPTFLEWD